VKGPTAAQVAGHIYRKLRQENYFGENANIVPLKPISTGN
jgi:hypothetical protein